MVNAVQILGLVLILAIAITHRKLHQAIIRRVSQPSPLQRYPSVTVIRPVRGLDTGAAENIAAALNVEYPGDVETIFVFDDEQEPAIPLVREAIVRYHEPRRVGRVIIAGPPPANRTGKLNAMIVGLREARGELIAFGDSDTRPRRDAIRGLVEKLLNTPGAGAAFAPVAMTSPAQTVGDAGCALMLNGFYSPAVAMFEQRRGDMPFIMGQLMLFKRQTFDAIGGLENIRGELVDDMHIGMRVVEAGLRNVMSYETLPIIVGGTTLPQFAATFRRWLIFSRSGLPGGSFKWLSWLQGSIVWTALILVAATAWKGHSWAAVVPLAAIVAFSWSIIRLHREIGGAPIAFRHAWLPLAIVVAGPFAIISALLWPEVDWRGRTYDLATDSRLSREDDGQTEPAWIVSAIRRVAGRQTRASIVLLTFLMPLAARALDAPRLGPGWTEAANSSNLVEFYRDDHRADARKIFAVTEGDGRPEEFFAALNEPGATPYVKEERVLKQVGPDDTVTYVRIHAPLISDRDSVLLTHTEHDPSGVIHIEWDTLSGFLPPNPGVVRMTVNQGAWTFEPIDGGRRTRMTYQVMVRPGGSIPTWIASSSAVRAAPNLFRSLKQRVAAEHHMKVGGSE